MLKTRTTLTIDPAVLRAVKIEAARSGQRDSEVIEGALRRALGLDDLTEIWAKVSPAPEAEAIELAESEVHAMRRERRASGRS